MGTGYVRRSTTEIATGEVIEAADFNNEFNDIVSSFTASTGHSHDGTTAEGGDVTKLLGTAITIGDGSAGADIVVTFDGETTDGVLTWMEDEDHFKFSDDIVIDSTKRLYFNDEGGEYIHGDGTDLNLVSGADINIPASIGLTFGNDGEKIEGDGTDLTIAGNNINLTAVADVVIPADVGITFGDAGEKIEGDGSDLTISSSAVLTLDAGGNIVIDSDGTVDVNSVGVLTLDSGAAINIEPATGSAILLDGTISIDAGVVTGATSITSTAFVGDVTGDITGTADVATVATTVTITDNESTDESNALIFTAGGDVDGGNLGLESDGTLTYNPSTGVATATGFVGALTGNVTGNASGTAATVTGAAQTAITSVGTLTGLTISGDLTVSGDDITMGTNTSGHILVADGTNYNPVAVSGDVGISAAGAITIASTAIESGMLNNNIISGQTALASGLATTDEILVSDAGTLKRVDVSVLTEITDGSATALAIALG